MEISVDRTSLNLLISLCNYLMLLNGYTIICKWFFRPVQRWLCQWHAPTKACFLYLPLSTKNLQMNAWGSTELCLDHTGSQLNLVALWVFFLPFFSPLYQMLVLTMKNMSQFKTIFPRITTCEIFFLLAENWTSAEEINQQHYFLKWNARSMEQRQVSSDF